MPLQTAIADLQRLGSQFREPANGQEALAELMAAEQAFSGGFLDGLEIDRQPEFEAWRLAERARYAELHRGLLRRIVESMPDNQRSVDYARQLVDIDSSDESSWALLVTQLLAVGNASGARQVSDLAHEELVREGVPLVGLLRDAMNGAAPKHSSDRSATGPADRSA